MTDRLAKLCDNAWFCFAVICGVSFITTVLPVMIGGLHASGDLGVYLGFAQEIRSAIEQGRYFPGWANDSLGYGSVGIRFYPPVGYYTSALISFVVGDWYVAVCVFLFLWMAIGCWGVFLLSREWVSPIWALFAAALYAIVPFHLAEIYQFTLYGEFAASGILPFCFLYATRLCRGGAWEDVILFALSSAALVLTHIPTTLIGAIGLSIYILMLADRRRIGSVLLKFTIATAGCLAASSFYWIRVVTEVDWLAHARPEYSAVLGGFSNWLFPYLLTASNSPEYYRPVLRSFDAMVIITAALFVLPVSLLISKRASTSDVRRVIKALTAVGTFGLFMLSYLSYFVWDGIKFLQRIQFPWRWLTVVSVVAVIACVMASASFCKTAGTLRKAAVLFLVGLIVLILAYDVRKNFMYGNLATRAEFQTILEAGKSPAGSNFAVWWPVWAKAEALEVADKVRVEGRPVEISRWEAESREFHVAAGAEGPARIATFYYPHWKATVNGERSDIAMDENGAMMLTLPADGSQVRLRFEEPALNGLCLILSVFTWFSLAAGALLTIVSKRYRRSDV